MSSEIAKALIRIAPSAQYVIRGSDIEWHSLDIPQPTKQEIELAIEIINSEKYREQRASEYPPIGDQLDDLFHSGMFSDEMRQKLQAVKDKYPKP